MPAGSLRVAALMPARCFSVSSFALDPHIEELSDTSLPTIDMLAGESLTQFCGQVHSLDAGDNKGQQGKKEEM
jgi:hypothetical protein